MKTEIKKEDKGMINDWFDCIGIAALNFFLTIIGVWILPQLPKHVQFWFALSLLVFLCYLVKKIVFFIYYEILKDENKKT